MNTALEYATSLRLTHTGKLLSASQKLLLILVALETDAGGISRIPVDALAERVLVNRRSVFRLISELQEAGVLAVLPQTQATGKTIPNAYAILDESGQIIPGAPSGARVLLMTPPNDKQALNVPRVTPLPLEIVSPVTPSPPQITPLPDRVTSLADNGLANSSNGTGFASPSPPNNNKGEGGVTGNTGVTDNTPVIELWLELIGRPYGLALTVEGANHIRSTVTNLEAWRYCLQGWLSSNWNKTNIAGQVDRYTTKVLPLPQFQTAPAPKIRSEAETAENDRAKKLIYGEG